MPYNGVGLAELRTRVAEGLPVTTALLTAKKHRHLTLKNRRWESEQKAAINKHRCLFVKGLLHKDTKSSTQKYTFSDLFHKTL